MEEAGRGEEGEAIVDLLTILLRGNGVGARHLTVLFDCTQLLLKKVAQLEEAWTQKDKFIHSSRMIIRFREDHISRLEKNLKADESSLSAMHSQAVIDQLKEEIKILRDQVKLTSPLNFFLIHC